MKKIFLTLFLVLFITGITATPFILSAVAHAAINDTSVGVDDSGAGGPVDTTGNVGNQPVNNVGNQPTDNVGNQPTGNVGNQPINNVGNQPNAKSDCTTQLCNPLLAQYGSLCDVLNGIILLVTQIGAVIAVLLIIWTGFKFITAQGNSDKLREAKKAFYTTLLGTAILLGASGIASIVVKTVLTVTDQNNPGICKI